MKPKTTIAAERPRQVFPEELVNNLLALIRRQFVPDISDREWWKDHNQFIKSKVVMWPARFVFKKGFTLPPERYQAIMIGILNDIKRHGQTGEVRFWPGYLMKCVQSHWEKHWEEYYAEAKAIRNKAEALLTALQSRQVAAPAPDVVEAIAKATFKPGPKKRKPAPSQTADAQGVLGL